MLCKSLFLFMALLSLEAANSQPSSDTVKKISLLFIGDIMGHDDQIKSAEDTLNHTYNYSDTFKYIRPILENADLSIANLEVTLAGPPYKGYPQFSSPDELAVACIEAGIDCFVTANNHVADRSKQGIVSSILNLDSLNIAHTGSFINESGRDSLSPLFIQKMGLSVAVLNYTYGTNGIAVPKPVIVNILDTLLISNDIEKAKRNDADLIVLFLHWGTEYDTVPSVEQTMLAKYFFSKGVHLIIGSHPHVLQKMIWTTDSVAGTDNIVVYSLGNFVSNQRKPKTDGGSMARIDLIFRGKEVEISSAGYFLTWVYVPVTDKRKKYYILPCSEYENNPSFFANPDDFIMMKKFISDSRNLLDIQNIGISEYSFNEDKWMLKEQH